MDWKLISQTIIKRKCVHCGKGSLFSGYLKVAPNCTHCKKDLSMLRADDGPIWLTIFIVAHIIVVLSLFLERHYDLSYAVIASVIIILSFVLTLSLLPFAKATFMLIIWLTKYKNN